MKAIESSYSTLGPVSVYLQDVRHLVSIVAGCCDRVTLSDDVAEFDDMDDLLQNRTGPLKGLDIAGHESPQPRTSFMPRKLIIELRETSTIVTHYNDDAAAGAMAAVSYLRPFENGGGFLRMVRQMAFGRGYWAAIHLVDRNDAHFWSRNRDTLIMLGIGGFVGAAVGVGGTLISQYIASR